MSSSKQRLERERAYAVERDFDAATQRSRPRLGGSAELPPTNGTSDLFLVSVDDLAIEERAGAGWCVRLGVPDAIPGTAEYDVHELLVELTVVMGGAAHLVEVNAYPGCTVHLVGEQIAARVKWGIAGAVVPPGIQLRWQVSRGLCATSGSRGYTVQAPGGGQVPIFATSFALFSGDSDISEDIRLQFATHTGADRIIQHYTREDLLQTIGAFAPLPPGAGVWSWLTATAEPVRLVFSLGAPL